MQNPKMDRATNTNTKRPHANTCRLRMQIHPIIPHTIYYAHLLWGSQSGVTYDYGKRVYSAGGTQPEFLKTE